MTAAGGLLHEEFHSPDFARQGGKFEMIQLWVNLPAKDKMTAPAYQAITNSLIPRISLPADAGELRIIAGRYEEVTGPARTFSPMNVWDLHLQPGHTTALFVLHGTIRVGTHTVHSSELAVLERDDNRLTFDIIEETILLLLSGEPLNEPIVGHGPFVMNSCEEIVQAIRDYENSEFEREVVSAN